MSDLTHLFTPIKIGNVTVPNRICHVPTDISSSHVSGEPSSRDIHHHQLLAKGGTGLIIVGATSPNGETGRSTVANLVIDSDKYIPSFARLASAMHEYGAICAVQLQHPGRQAALPREGKLTASDQAVTLPWSQSRAIVYANADEAKKTVHVLSTDEVIEIVEEFGEAAWRLKQAGFDAVELHAAHGYLISQFMSPLLNTRNDRFGGSFENRMRFPLAIIASIQNKCGWDYPIIVRYSGDEWADGGRQLPESLEVAKRFEHAGVAALDISQCIQESPGAGFDPMPYPEGWTTYQTDEIKKIVTIPVINSHTLRNPEYCEKIIAEGKTDMVGLSRQLLADPYWPIKAKYGKLSEIRKCISCLTGCWQESMMAKTEISCAINPECGNKDFSTLKPAVKSLNIAVVGGGPGGMEAARYATVRGHKVTIFEKTGELGGAILGCCVTPGKEKMKWYADWIRGQIARLGIKVEYYATPTVKQMKDFDLVINATGASSWTPDVHGKKDSVIPMESVMACPKISCEFHPQDGRKPVKLSGENVVVWGDHYPAVDTVVHLASIGKKVTVITDNKAFAEHVEVIHMYVFRKRFDLTDAEALESKPYKHPVTVIESSYIDEIRDNEIDIIGKDFKKTTIPCDHVVTCWVKPNTQFFDELKASGVPVVNAGDSVKPRNLHAAVREGAHIGRVTDGNDLFNPNDAIVNELPLDVLGQLQS
jgi:2,4-dienoyl-CoA reductase-like NADH-dependent reductase (Old Yellow Enzyme family)/thioredoxin reductase